MIYSKFALYLVYTCKRASSDQGKLCDEVDIPPHPTAQVTSVTWHPSKRILAIGWETGELYLWNDHEHEFHEIQSLHRAPISILCFSAAGARLVSADAVSFKGLEELCEIYLVT